MTRSQANQPRFSLDATSEPTREIIIPDLPLPQLKESNDGSRQINIAAAISPGVALEIIGELLAYETAAPGVPITLHIFSPGGCVISELAIIDTMRHITSPVFTVTIGNAASMAAVIAACGQKDHRYILPHSRFMIHQASGMAAGTMDNLRATLEFQSSLEHDVDRILAEATGRTVEEIREASRVDNWMNANDARGFGLVD